MVSDQGGCRALTTMNKARIVQLFQLLQYARDSPLHNVHRERLSWWRQSEILEWRSGYVEHQTQVGTMMTGFGKLFVKVNILLRRRVHMRAFGGFRARWISWQKDTRHFCDHPLGFTHLGGTHSQITHWESTTSHVDDLGPNPSFLDISYRSLFNFWPGYPGKYPNPSLEDRLSASSGNWDIRNFERMGRRMRWINRNSHTTDKRDLALAQHLFDESLIGGSKFGIIDDDRWSTLCLFEAIIAFMLHPLSSEIIKRLQLIYFQGLQSFCQTPFGNYPCPTTLRFGDWYWLTDWASKLQVWT